MHGSGTGSVALLGVVFLCVAVAYFSPTVVAFVRHHRQKVAIGALNALLGWTLLGWVGSLVWSLTSEKE